MLRANMSTCRAHMSTCYDSSLPFPPPKAWLNGTSGEPVLRKCCTACVHCGRCAGAAADLQCVAWQRLIMPAASSSGRCGAVSCSRDMVGPPPGRPAMQTAMQLSRPVMCVLVIDVCSALRKCRQDACLTRKKTYARRKTLSSAGRQHNMAAP
jgi:hypothetical protein